LIHNAQTHEHKTHLSYTNASGRNVLQTKQILKYNHRVTINRTQISILGCPQGIIRTDVVVGTGLNLQGYE